MSQVMINEWLKKNSVTKCPTIYNGSDTKAVKTDNSQVTKVVIPHYAEMRGEA